jgi:antitoxin FitA
MAAVTVRNLAPEIHRALKVRAALNNRSTEAEIRSILEEAVRPEHQLGLGTAIARMSAQRGLSNADVEALEDTLATLRQDIAEPLVLE